MSHAGSAACGGPAAAGAGRPHVSAGLGTMLLGVSGSWEDSEVTSLPEDVPKEPDSEKETWGSSGGEPRGGPPVHPPPPPPPLPAVPGAHQLLEGGGRLQVALQREVAERLPGRLVGLHLHRAALHGALVPDGAAGHQRRPGEALQALRARGASARRPDPPRSPPDPPPGRSPSCRCAAAAGAAS